MLENWSWLRRIYKVLNVFDFLYYQFRVEPLISYILSVDPSFGHLNILQSLRLWCAYWKRKGAIGTRTLGHGIWYYLVMHFGAFKWKRIHSGFGGFTINTWDSLIFAHDKQRPSNFHSSKGCCIFEMPFLLMLASWSGLLHCLLGGMRMINRGPQKNMISSIHEALLKLSLHCLEPLPHVEVQFHLVALCT